MKRLKHCWSRRGSALSWLAVSLLGVALAAQADLYEYRDVTGRRVFVDRLSAVPLEYRDQLTQRDRIRMSPEERAKAQRLQQQARLRQSIGRIDRLLEQAVTPIGFKNNQVVVPVSVERGNRTRELKLLLDTGASRTVFHRQALEGVIGQNRRAGAAVTASGEQIPLYQAQVDRLLIGPFEISPAQVQMLEFKPSASAQEPHQGLLGMDLLSKVRYELDLDAQELHWAPEQTARLREERIALIAELESLKAPVQTEPEPVPSVPSTDDRAQ